MEVRRKYLRSFNPLFNLDSCVADCFAELLLDKLPTNQIQAWVGTNRGAFVVCRYAHELM